jgi:NDP-sugar pyrophosphorylase family protein
MNVGIYYLNRELIATLPENRNISLEKDLFSPLIGKEFFAFPQETKFIDIGTPFSYKEAETFFTKIDKSIKVGATSNEEKNSYYRHGRFPFG